MVGGYCFRYDLGARGSCADETGLSVRESLASRGRAVQEAPEGAWRGRGSRQRLPQVPLRLRREAGCGERLPQVPLGLRLADVQARPSQLHDLSSPSVRLRQMRALLSRLLQVRNYKCHSFLCCFGDINCVSSSLSMEVYMRIVAWATWGDWVRFVQSNAYLLFVQWCLSV